MRLIDADALKEQFREGAYTIKGIREEIDNAPTVEFPEQIKIKCDTEEDKQKLLSALRNAKLKVFVEDERPQGEWQLHGMIYYCSECGHECGESGDNFCGNCGADMRVKDELNNELK